MKFLGSAAVLALSASLVAATPRPTAAPAKRQAAPDFSGLNLSQLSASYTQALNGISSLLQQGGDNDFVSSEKAVIDSAFSAAFSTLSGAGQTYSAAVSSVLSGASADASSFFSSAASAATSVASEVSASASAESTSIASDISSVLSTLTTSTSTTSTTASTSAPSGAAGHAYTFDVPVSLALTSVAGLVAAVFVL